MPRIRQVKKLIYFIFETKSYESSIIDSERVNFVHKPSKLLLA